MGPFPQPIPNTVGRSGFMSFICGNYLINESRHSDEVITCTLHHNLG